MRDDDRSLYGLVWDRWYKMAKERCMQDHIYVALDKEPWLDVWEQQQEIMDRLAPMPKWLELWRQVRHEDKLKPRWWKNQAVHYYQRARQGYSYQDLWSFDWYLSNVCEKAFIEMRDQAHGWPGEPMTFEEWLDIHTKISEAFKAKREQHDIDFKDKEQHDRDYAILEAKWIEGMELFTKWSGGFWN